MVQAAWHQRTARPSVPAVARRLALQAGVAVCAAKRGDWTGVGAPPGVELDLAVPIGSAHRRRIRLFRLSPHLRLPGVCSRRAQGRRRYSLADASRRTRRGPSGRTVRARGAHRPGAGCQRSRRGADSSGGLVRGIELLLRVCPAVLDAASLAIGRALRVSSAAERQAVTLPPRTRC